MKRFRRFRQNEALRNLVCETRLDPKDLIYPLFVVEGTNIKEPIATMPDIYRYSLDRIDEELECVQAAGISGILLFGVPAHKDAVGSSAYDPHGILAQAITHIQSKLPHQLVIADVCLCEYTDHGHCGLVHEHAILNDETLPLLAKMAVCCVQAGADMVAPNDMMDGDITAIRQALDAHGLSQTPIMGYSAKYASGYYSPFRDAAGSAPCFGDRRSYQMDPRNGKEGVREVENDIDMVADIVMVKPALAYLDVVKAVSEHCSLPLAVYNVSGEYAMVKAAAKAGMIDEKRIVCENLMVMKRAGAQIIIAYHALEMAHWLETGEVYAI